MNQEKQSLIVISLRKGCGQTSQLKGISGKSGILRLILKTKIFCVWINRSKKVIEMDQKEEWMVFKVKLKSGKKKRLLSLSALWCTSITVKMILKR